MTMKPELLLIGGKWVSTIRVNGRVWDTAEHFTSSAAMTWIDQKKSEYAAQQEADKQAGKTE